MALRVLLADESSTIKKVMQLSLQDFGVEVKAVPVGIDVLEVARQFKPDIVFADILLAKRNGYEVSGDLKKDTELRSIPVVLMWSSFMELDEKAFAKSHADGRLEKPFDVENLRGLVIDLVPKTQAQRLAQFLKFPETITEEFKQEQDRPTSIHSSASIEAEGRTKGKLKTVSSPQEPQPIQDQTTPFAHSSVPQLELAEMPPIPPPAQGRFDVNAKKGPTPAASSPAAPSTALPPETNASSPPLELPSWSMDSFEPLNVSSLFENTESSEDKSSDSEDADSFEPLQLHKLSKSTPPPVPTADDPVFDLGDTGEDLTEDAKWSRQDLSNFKPNFEPVAIDSEELSLSLNLDHLQSSESEFEMKPLERVKSERGARERLGSLDSAAHSEAYAKTPSLSIEQLEEIVRAQSQEVIEEVVRRVVPELAEKMIRSELEKILREMDAP